MQFYDPDRHTPFIIMLCLAKIMYWSVHSEKKCHQDGDKSESSLFLTIPDETALPSTILQLYTLNLYITPFCRTVTNTEFSI